MTQFRILLIAKAFPPETGGIETYSEEVAKAYTNHECHVDVLTAHPGHKGKESRGRITVYNVGQGNQLSVFLRMLAWLIKRRKQNYRFIHSTSWRVGIPPLFTMRREPLVVTIHGREVFVVPAVLKPIMNFVLKRSAFLPTVSRPILNLVRQRTKLSLSQGFSNWNGTSEFGEVKSYIRRGNGFNIFCLCRLVPRKNLSNAIKAVADLIREGKDIQFDIGGGGEEFSRLSEELETEDIGTAIRLHGRIPDKSVPEFYGQAHVFLHPQIAKSGGGDLEGFGITIADSMLFGCVAVAGNVGGPSDFIEHEKNGFLVDGDDVENIKNVIRYLYDNRLVLTSVSREGQAFAARMLTWRQHTRNILSKFD